MYPRTLRLKIASMEAVMLALAFITFVMVAGLVNDALYERGILREQYVADVARFYVELSGIVPVLLESWLTHYGAEQWLAQSLTTFACIAGTAVVTVGPLYLIAL